MSSPAERYAAARRRAAHPKLAEFAAGLDFALDEFQRIACEGLERGSSVLVCAPTGAGKTVVGEFAVHLALRQQAGKCFYTTPIKALSNQKYHDLVRVHGADRVGLLTGDTSVNGAAPVVVMTTEVLRNMLYAGSATLTGLAYVVMDEVHYLADRFRGAVWEEVIIHLPASVSLVSLSATVSNAEEFADWLVTVRGETEVVVSEHRPVPLWQHMLVGRRMFDLFQEEGQVHPELLRHIRELTRRMSPTGGRGGHDRRRGYRGWRAVTPSRPEVVERLDREGLLPTIMFIFSRAGCDAAVQQCLHAGLRLTTPEERTEIRAVAQARVVGIPAEDLTVLGYRQWLDGLERGLAAHHAGALPAFKEVVEELFVRGLVKAVFATETLALGINMPARCVVLERLVKFDGEAHVDLTPGEYTQLTGRAGRRGIDVEGHAVVAWSPELDPRQVAGLASTRTYPLRSSFRPSYNMAVNLVGALGVAQARTLLESSFAQFQADRAVVGIARQVQRNTEAIAAHTADLSCHLGDFEAYFALRRKITERERGLARETATARRAAALAALSRLRVGDVVRVPAGRRAGLAVVLDPDTGGFGEPKPLLLTDQRWAGRVPASDFVTPVEALARVRVPRHFNHRSPAARRDLAASLRVAQIPPAGRRRARGTEDQALTRLRGQLRQHPCHGCEQREEHARAAERRSRLERDTEALRAQATSRTGSLARTFDQVVALLTARGYLTGHRSRATTSGGGATTGGGATPGRGAGSGRGATGPGSGTDQVTDAGRTLSRIWTESDLLVAECLRRGLWDGLGPAQLAAAVSVTVYQSRRDGGEPVGVPRGAVADAIDETGKLWDELAADEAGRGLSLTREPDPGFAWPIFRWVRGEPLAQVLASGSFDGDLPAGDFVRWARQVVDLLAQLIDTDGVPGPVREAAGRAVALIGRGVVADSGVVGPAAQPPVPPG